MLWGDHSYNNYNSYCIKTILEMQYRKLERTVLSEAWIFRLEYSSLL